MEGEKATTKRRGFKVWARSFVATVAITLLLSYVGVSIAEVISATGAAPASIPAALALQVAPAHQDVSFQSRVDNLTLKGWLFQAANPSGRAVIFVPGWKSNRTSFLNIAHDMVGAGYGALLYDTRAAGESAGSYETLGNLERRDVLGAYDFMHSQGYQSRQLVVYGTSMGGASALEALPRMTEVGAVIIDSTFADLGPVLGAQWAKVTSMPPVTDILGVNLARFVGVDPGLRPVDVVTAHPERAFLFFHAAGDGLIPVANANDLFAASRNPQSQLFITAGKSHQDTYGFDPKLYMQRVYAFLATQMS